jgi:methionine synthase II (cobalamin-independent)
LSGTTDRKGAKFLGSMLTGLVSRSSYTAKTHRLLRDGKITESVFNSAIASDSEKIISRQRNFAFVSGGQLDWLDIIRPIAEYFEGFEGIYNKAFEYKTNDNSSHIGKASLGEYGIMVGPVTRWFRTNTFYRKPLVSGRIKCAGSELAKIMPLVGENSVIFLPSPYSLAKLVENNTMLISKTSQRTMLKL